MPARAIWKGQISFGAANIGVKLYSAVQDKSVRFRLLDEKTKQPVKQKMVDPESGEPVESADVQKAFPVSKAKMVVLEKEEIEAIAPKESREIEVTRFLPIGKITHQWFDRPYYLGPDGNAGAYFALARALANQGREGLARWVMRKKEYVGSLRAEGDYLMLIALRHANEVISAASLEPPAGRDLAAREVEMARKLIESMVGKLDMSEFRDEYRERVLEYVEAKAKGKVVKFPRARAKKTDDLTDALEKSLAAARRASA